MDRTRQWIGFTLAAACALGPLFFVPRHPIAPRISTPSPLPQEAYLWQRSWTPAVRAAIQQESSAFSRLVVLTRQIDWDNQRQPHLTRIAVDWAALQSTHTPIAAALRISPFPGPFDDASTTAVADAIAEVAHEAAAANLPLAEIQVDFDAATSQLASYRRWLAAARRLSPIPITFTALPAWLHSPDFPTLAADARSYVLQVHWLQHPHRLTDPLVLCDIPTARAAINAAAAFNIPFRVALPTYGYLVAYNPDGAYAGIAAENAPTNWASTKTVRRIEAAPDQLASFVNELATNRPIALSGIIWYRLPVAADRLNWCWTTLRSVMLGCVPRPGALEAPCVHTAPTLTEIRLTNTGQQDITPAVTLHVHWTNAARIASDAFAGFDCTDVDDTSLTLAPRAGVQTPLAPGESRPIAWVRLTSETDLAASLDPAPADDHHPPRILGKAP